MSATVQISANFDTQAFFDQLIESGFEEKQAKGMLDAIKNLPMGSAATVEQTLEKRIYDLEVKTTKQFHHLDRKIDKNLLTIIGTMIVLSGIIIAAGQL